MAMTVPTAQVTTSAWYNDPEFVAARNHTIPAGGATSYDETPPIGRVPWDMTGFVYGQATWSTRHMPDILYRLRPSNDWYAFKTTGPPQQRIDAYGWPMYEQWPDDRANPRPFLDFEILPDRIGSEEHWWRFEAWRRLDPRIRWCDIHMRMEPPYRHSDVLLRSRISRPRASFFILSWFQGPRGQTANDQIVARLSLAQIQANTTRGSTPGLIDPARGQAGGRVYLVDEGPADDTVSESSESESESESDTEAGPVGVSAGPVGVSADPVGVSADPVGVSAGPIQDSAAGIAVEDGQIAAGPAGEGTGVSAIENIHQSHVEEGGAEQEDVEHNEEEPKDHDKEFDREETIEPPSPKRQRVA